MQAGNILIDHQGQVILADMGIATAMTRSHRLHEGGALDSQPQVRSPVLVRVIACARWLALPPVLAPPAVRCLARTPLE